MNNITSENDQCDDTALESCVRCAEPIEKSTLDVDYEDSYNSDWTPFLRACRFGQTENVVQLISKGVDVTACDSLGWNALPLAVASGNVDTLQEVLKAVKWNRNDLAPALCLAALNGDRRMAEILLASRGSPNTPIENSKITPLMLAAGEGHIEMVSLLLQYGADSDMTNALHQTALDAAVVRNQISIQNILGPVTHLRSKISSHIPLPISPPNRALQSPNFQSNHSNFQFLGTSPLISHCQSYSPGFGSSPMLHCLQVPSPICGTRCFRSNVDSPVRKNKGCLSPLPASYPLVMFPFNVAPGSCQNPCDFVQDFGGSSQSIAGIKLDQKSVSKGNKKLKKWWCHMKKRCKTDQQERQNGDIFINENNSHNVVMEKRLENFLRSIKMTEYQSLFNSQEIDFETFLSLTEEDLEEIGVKNSAHRSKIVEKIVKFSKYATNI